MNKIYFFNKQSILKRKRNQLSSEELKIKSIAKVKVNFFISVMVFVCLLISTFSLEKKLKLQTIKLSLNNGSVYTLNQTQEDFNRYAELYKIYSDKRAKR
jgi:hypothetical protein